MEKSVVRSALVEKRVIYCTLLFGGILAFYPYLTNYVNQGSQVLPYWNRNRCASKELHRYDDRSKNDPEQIPFPADCICQNPDMQDSRK